MAALANNKCSGTRKGKRRVLFEKESLKSIHLLIYGLQNAFKSYDRII
jgi:hypothetical protein